MSEYFQSIVFTSQGVTHASFSIGEKARLSLLARDRPHIYSLCERQLPVDDLTEKPITCLECIVKRDGGET